MARSSPQRCRSGVVGAAPCAARVAHGATPRGPELVNGFGGFPSQQVALEPVALS